MEEGKKDINIRQMDKTFEELKTLQATVKRFKPGDLIVPILSLIALTLLTIFVYIPMLTNAAENRTETKDTQTKIETLTKLNTDLDSIDLATLQTDLANSRKVIPFSLQVSDFLSYVDTSAKSKGLKFREILAGDIAIKSSTEKKGFDAVIKGVSGPLKYTGTLNQISEFLDQLQASSPYIISADQIKLKKTTEASIWEISITVTGYYIDKNSLPTPNIYSPFSSYTQYQDVLNIFKEKAAKST